jgi:hypothetical protein
MHIEYDNKFLYLVSHEEMIPLIDYGDNKFVPFNTKSKINSMEELNKAEEVIRQRLVTRDFDSGLLKIVDEETGNSITFRAWHNFCMESCHLGLSQKEYYLSLSEILKRHSLINYLETLPNCRSILTLTRKDVQDAELFIEYSTKLVSFRDEEMVNYSIVFFEDILKIK